MKAMHVIRKAVRSLVCIWVLTTVAGCEQRELCYDHSHGAEVDLFFDWSMEPDANVSTMVVWAYPDDGSQGQRFEFDASRTRSSEGYTIKLPPGTWRLTCYNGNTENNREQGKLPGDLQITTFEHSLLAPLNRSGNAPRPPLTENQPVRSPASHIYAADAEEPLTILPQKGHTIMRYKATFVPRRATAIWNIRVEEVTGLARAIEASGIVTGAAESWSVTHAAPFGREVTVPFGMTVCTEGEECLRAAVIVFGDTAPHEVCHHLRVYTTTNYYYDYDVTDQIHSAPDPKNVHIVVKGMKLPETGSGMSPGVSDWVDAENIELDL